MRSSFYECTNITLYIKLGLAYKALRDIVDCANAAGELSVNDIIGIIEESGIKMEDEEE